MGTIGSILGSGFVGNWKKLERGTGSFSFFVGGGGGGGGGVGGGAEGGIGLDSVLAPVPGGSGSES